MLGEKILDSVQNSIFLIFLVYVLRESHRISIWREKVVG